MALMRDRVGGAITNAPLTIVLRRPNGLEFKRTTLPAQPAGGFRLSIDLPDTASRGGWSVEALDADDKPVGHAAVEVQDFVPQRLKVTAQSAAKILHVGDTVTVNIDGRFLYGAPASNLGAEAHMDIAVDPAPFPQSANGYHFGVANPHFSSPEVELEVPATDGDGHTTATGKIEKPDADNLPLKATITAGIQEPGGRVTNDELTLPIRAGGHSIGIRPRFTNDRIGEGEDAAFEVIAVDDEGSPVAARLHWTLIEETRHYDWLQTDGRWSYHVSTTDKPVESGDLDVTADKPATLHHPVDWGGYRLEIEEPSSGAASSLPFYAGWMETADSADTPDKVAVTVEREKYPVGETAHLKIVPPFAGRVQLMVARDKVFETRELDVPKEGATVDVPVSADWGSGAYVLASLYRPADGGRGASAGAGRRARLGRHRSGPASDDSGAQRARPGDARQTVQVPVKITGGKPGEAAYLTLTAVDEGILQLTRFATPDPNSFYFGKRRLGAEIRDDYGRLLDGTEGRRGGAPQRRR